nr:hypothetical protein [Salinilacihabitans rarus]
MSDMSRDSIREYDLEIDIPELGLHGIANRAVFVVDEDGTVTYRWVADDPTSEPDYEEILDAVETAGAVLRRKQTRVCDSHAKRYRVRNRNHRWCCYGSNDVHEKSGCPATGTHHTRPTSCYGTNGADQLERRREQRGGRPL